MLRRMIIVVHDVLMRAVGAYRGRIGTSQGGGRVRLHGCWQRRLVTTMKSRCKTTAERATYVATIGICSMWLVKGGRLLSTVGGGSRVRGATSKGEEEWVGMGRWAGYIGDGGRRCGCRSGCGVCRCPDGGIEDRAMVGTGGGDRVCMSVTRVDGRRDGSSVQVATEWGGRRHAWNVGVLLCRLRCVCEDRGGRRW